MEEDGACGRGKMMSSSKMRNSRYQGVFVAGACRSVAAIGPRSRWKNKVIRIQILDLPIRPVVCISDDDQSCSIFMRNSGFFISEFNVRTHNLFH
jgi:hypothetical protein